jgi:hypothetical protein
MNDTSKILKELSNLTLNMDVLAKELKESNAVSKDTNKELSSLVKEIKGSESKDKPSDKSVDKTGEEKNFKNFSESIMNAFNKQNEGFLGNLQKTLIGGLPGISKAEIKPAGVEKQESKPGQTTKDIISAVAGRLLNVPKLESGGKVSSSGVALVGEKGPELVELQKGNVVNSQDKMAELLKMEMDDLKKSQEKKENAAGKDLNKEASKLVSGEPKLDEFVTNSFGVKVPKSEIDAYRKEIYDEYKDEFDKDPSFLEDEMKIFIDNYRESFSVSDLQKLSDKDQPKEIKKSEDLQKLSDKDQPKGIKKLEDLQKLSDKNQPKEIKKSEDEIQKEKGSKTENAKSKLQEILSSPKLNPLKSLREEGAKLAEKIKPQQNILSEKNMEPEGMSSGNVSAKDIQALTERLKQGSKLSNEAQTLKTGEKKTTSTTPAATASGISATSAKELNAGVKPDIQTVKPEKQSSGDSSSVMTEQDIKEIKALLAGIYKSISGPLSIASDRPYRPNSNTF